MRTKRYLRSSETQPATSPAPAGCLAASTLRNPPNPKGNMMSTTLETLEARVDDIGRRQDAVLHDLQKMIDDGGLVDMVAGLAKIDEAVHLVEDAEALLVDTGHEPDPSPVLRARRARDNVQKFITTTAAA